MNKLNAFVKEFKAIIVGDDAEALGFKNWRKAESGLKVQIAALNGDIIAKEDALENAQENLVKARVNYGKEIADNCSILYGGSCKPSNAKELFANPDVDGGLIGGAALKVSDFKGIIDAFN